MREYMLRWYGHVMKREGTEAIRVIMRMNVEERRGKSKIGHF